MKPKSIASINQLPPKEKEAIYTRFIPNKLLQQFEIQADFIDADGRSLLNLRSNKGSTDVVLDLRHEFGAQDPLLYTHLTDTMNGQIHVLLYIVNDPNSPRFGVDKMPDGTPTEFGVFRRNLIEEEKAVIAGLAPGQVRQGLRLLKHAIPAFDEFVQALGHDVYFIEPLSYHNAIVFERYGFSYQKGRRLMMRINAGFQPASDLFKKLDDSTPFRKSSFYRSIRGRSWAIHDCILGEPYSDVTMYKKIGKNAGLNTFPDAKW
ncbi:MAG: hypothetical protein E3J30_07235 [Anaerolineales bacterium]|nr:MAG: hypothetical protein E3J30_07235 [Anaerolineales bacterium]